MSKYLLMLITRKMVMFYLSLASIVILSLWDKLSTDNFMISFIAVLGAFVTGNVMEYKYRDFSNTKNTITLDDNKIANATLDNKITTKLL